ncbi:unnamed protein product [Cylicostephanus goldi]|uniref:Uncharacterized protein n=1 Tax=Cylicostephanus goldi TaxID=71465 RepID=A0A3P6RQP7_CYLGO|nr:unnamed protein product [Cylicostephanus goldi]
MPQQRLDSEEETSTRRPTTTTSTRATTATSTAPRTTTSASAERRVPVLERAREIEPARAEKSKFISAAQKNDDVPDRAVSESESSTQANGDKRSSPSLITVYEVTTSAVKNREIHETYKPPVPWWVAVAVGFIVSVVIAWAVVILLRK